MIHPHFLKFLIEKIVLKKEKKTITQKQVTILCYINHLKGIFISLQQFYALFFVSPSVHAM